MNILFFYFSIPFVVRSVSSDAEYFAHMCLDAQFCVAVVFVKEFGNVD